MAQLTEQETVLERLEVYVPKNIYIFDNDDTLTEQEIGVNSAWLAAVLDNISMHEDYGKVFGFISRKVYDHLKHKRTDNQDADPKPRDLFGLISAIKLFAGDGLKWDDLRVELNGEDNGYAKLVPFDPLINLVKQILEGENNQVAVVTMAIDEPIKPWIYQQLVDSNLNSEQLRVQGIRGLYDGEHEDQHAPGDRLVDLDKHYEIGDIQTETDFFERVGQIYTNIASTTKPGTLLSSLVSKKSHVRRHGTGAQRAKEFYAASLVEWSRREYHTLNEGEKFDENNYDRIVVSVGNSLTDAVSSDGILSALKHYFSWDDEQISKYSDFLEVNPVTNLHVPASSKYVNGVLTHNSKVNGNPSSYDVAIFSNGNPKAIGYANLSDLPNLVSDIQYNSL
ncbi:MAG: hypothetical protein GOU98_00945 [Candidatus Altiarchaeota archaeon]|nr:hypothetical protein [Candidatus Altiarchaeota archaeon]